MKRTWIRGDQKANMKVWESPFIPSHLTFKIFKFTHFQSINQTINQIYLFIITFQNLEFWDVTNLPPLNESRPRDSERLERKRLGFGGSPQNSINHHRGSGVLPPLETWLQSHQNLYTPSIILDSVGLLRSLV